MVATALRALREEGACSVCVGVGPLERLGQIDGCAWTARFISRSSYRLAAKVLHLHGRTEFWEKFRVTRREPLFLLFQSPRIGFREVNALLRAFHLSVS